MAQIVYMTAPDRATAGRLADMLVERHLAAGVTLVPGAWSVYHWNDAIQRHEEVVLLAHTADDRVDALTAAVAAHHPYVTPCVVHWPLEGGHPAFLDWITRSTR